MRILNISISDSEFKKFRFKKDSLHFSELLELINNGLVRNALNESITLSKKYGLSSMSMDDITKEVIAIRRIDSNQ
jgi:hypothetical protein